MIKQILKLSTVSLAILVGFTSCESDDPEPVMPKGDFENGYLISNEGNFGSPNASVTFIDTDLMQETNEVYQTVNSTPLGDTFQSIAFDDNYAFLVVKTSNKIEVVDRYTFKNVATITDKLGLPSYAVVENDKLYVSNEKTKSVEVFDANSFAHITSITVNKTVAEIKKENDFIYIMNASFGTGNTITVIDSNTDAIVKDITIGDGLNSFEIEDSVLYALHNGGVAIVSTSTNELTGEIHYENELSRATNLEVEDDYIYFTSGTKIYKYDKNVTSFADTELVDTQAKGASWGIGYAFDVLDDKIFYSDVNGFTENSEIMVYDLDGKLVKTFEAGMGSNGVYVND